MMRISKKFFGVLHLSSAPPNRIHIRSLNLVRIVCRLADSSLDSCSLVEGVRALNFVWSFLIIVVWAKFCWPWSINSMEWCRFALIFGM